MAMERCSSSDQRLVPDVGTPTTNGFGHYGTRTQGAEYVGGGFEVRGLDYCKASQLPVPFGTAVMVDRARISRRPLRGRRRSLVRRCCVYFCLVALNVVVSAAVCLCVMKFVRLPGSEQDSTARRICVPCEDIVGRQVEPVNSGQTTGRPNNVCCGPDDAAQWRELIVEGVKSTLKERLKGDNLYSLLNRPFLPQPINRFAVHVFLKHRRYLHPSHSYNRRDDEVTLKNWTTEGNAAFIREGVEFDSSQGHFQVKDAGIYVIYGRLVYEKIDNNGDDDDNSNDDDENGDLVVLGQSVNVFSHRHYRKLIEDERATKCSIAEAPCYSSQIFSTLHLTKNSVIAIRARRPDLLADRIQASYFGLYKID